MKISTITLFLLFFLINSSLQSICHYTCQSCTSESPFACNSCLEDSTLKTEKYIFSCQYFTKNNPLYVVLCVFVVLLDLFMLSMGFGVYQPIYGFIQLTSIFIWVQIGDNGVVALQGSNFALQYNNSFSRTYGVQFILSLFILIVFLCLVISVQKIPHNSTAILIRRKRVIFPLRITSLIYNMQLFSSLASLSTISSVSNTDIFELFVTILSIGTIAVIYGFTFYICNFKNYKLDDPNYYVVTEELISTRPWVKNKITI